MRAISMRALRLRTLYDASSELSTITESARAPPLAPMTSASAAKASLFIEVKPNSLLQLL